MMQRAPRSIMFELRTLPPLLLLGSIAWVMRGLCRLAGVEDDYYD